MGVTPDRLSFFFPAGFIYLVAFSGWSLFCIGGPIYYNQSPLDYHFWQEQVLAYGPLKGVFILSVYSMMILGMLYSAKLCLATPYNIIFYPGKVVLRNVFGLKKTIYAEHIKTVNVQEISPYVSEISLEMQVGKKVSFRVMRKGSVEPSVLKMWKSDCGMFQ